MILKYLLGGTKPLEDAYANVNLSKWATWGRNFVKQPEGFLTNDIKVYKLHKTLHSSKGMVQQNWWLPYEAKLYTKWESSQYVCHMRK